jgi:tetratricopeptide (TPR) repeat protein
MARALAKSPVVLFALGLLIFTSSACSAKDDLESLNQRIYKLFTEGRYQEAIPLSEKAVEIAKRARGPEHPETATALNNLGSIFTNIGDYAKTEPLLREALRIRQKVLGNRLGKFSAISPSLLALINSSMPNPCLGVRGKA